MYLDAHPGAMTIAHQDVVTHPNGDILAAHSVRHGESCRHAFFFACGNISLTLATAFARRNEIRQRGVVFSCMLCKRVFGRNRAESHPHNGVRTGGKYIEFAILYECPVVIFDLMCKRSEEAVAFANPVSWNGATALGPPI